MSDFENMNNNNTDENKTQSNDELNQFIKNNILSLSSFEGENLNQNFSNQTESNTYENIDNNIQDSSKLNNDDNNYYDLNGETIDFTSKKKFSFLTDGYFFSFLIVFFAVFSSFVFIFNYIYHPIKIVGISMRPTINSASYNKGDSDEDHCDYAYYIKKNSYKNNDIVIVNNTNYKYIPKTQKNDVKSVIKRVIATEFQTITFSLEKESDLVYSSTTSYYINYYYSIAVYDKNGENINLDQYYLDKNEEMYFTVDFNYFTKSESFRSYREVFNEIFSGVKNNADHKYRYEVSENCYFVMGDNRNNSEDSRYFGEVSYDDIAGLVEFIVPYKSNILLVIWKKFINQF